jgi:hypothetical protein
MVTANNEKISIVKMKHAPRNGKILFHFATGLFFSSVNLVSK